MMMMMIAINKSKRHGTQHRRRLSPHMADVYALYRVLSVRFIQTTKIP